VSRARPWPLLLPTLLIALLVLGGFLLPAREPAAPVAGSRAAAPEAPSDLIAHRRYENLLSGRRAGTIDVVWSRAEWEGRRVVKDVTTFRTRTARMMGGMRDIFESTVVATTYRTEGGELLATESVATLPSRVDRESVRRTEKGYAVVQEVGENRKAWEFETAGPAYVDAECFLGPRIRDGSAVAGARYTYALLDTEGKRLLESQLAVSGPDAEGPGLKVVETLRGADVLWWFSEDGSVVRQRNGDTVLQRRDDLSDGDLRGAPAAYSITLPSDVDLPRLFTAKCLEVELTVRTDETVQPPRIPENPFTEVIGTGPDRVRLRLRSHDDPESTTTLPIAPEGFLHDLEATPLMESDDPEFRAVARKIVGGETDARRAAVAIADFVFTGLKKGSPEIPEPTARETLRGGIGDCSEHALLFTALCRAAGIPARRCSGYVNIGSDWGSHSWCEVWVGRWIGADPTTNEIGTRGRYIFCGRPEEPTMTPARIWAERTTIAIRRAEFDDGTLDFEGQLDPVVFSGIRLGPLPESWHASCSRRGASVTTPAGRLDAMLEPDHGYRTGRMLAQRGYGGFEPARFGQRNAFVQEDGPARYWIVPLGRELLHIQWRPDRGAAPAPPPEMPSLFQPIFDR